MTEATIKINKKTRTHGETLKSKGYEVSERDDNYVIQCNELIDGEFDTVESFVGAIKEAIPAKNLFSYKTKVAGVSGVALLAKLSGKELGAKALTAFIAKGPKPEKEEIPQKSLEDFDI